MDHDRRLRKELAPEQLSALKTLHTEFEDASIVGRLQQYVGPANWDSQEVPDFVPIAQELIDDVEVLRSNWSWLTSGEAGQAWRLGEVLAKLDTNTTLAGSLPDFPDAGRDNRLLCGYLQVKRAELGDDWFDQWVVEQQNRGPIRTAMLFEVAWRCGATDRLVRIVIKILRSEEVPPEVVDQLSFGRWGEYLSTETFLELVHTMKDSGHEYTAVSLLNTRLKARPEEIDTFSELALGLVLMPDLIKSSQMANYHWKELATSLITEHARDIAAEIFKAHASLVSGHWSIEYSEAINVLNDCLNVDPLGVWQEITKYLESRESAAHFSIGFPKNLLDKIPPDAVMTWVSSNPIDRADRVVRITSKDLSSDELLTARLLGEYGDIESVGNVFFSEFWSGSWFGPSSLHWDELGSTLEEVAVRTKLPKLRSWAANSARAFRKMAEEERKHEEEENLRGH
jgi:hypothetical protein